MHTCVKILKYFYSVGINHNYVLLLYRGRSIYKGVNYKGAKYHRVRKVCRGGGGCLMWGCKILGAQNMGTQSVYNCSNDDNLK